MSLIDYMTNNLLSSELGQKRQVVTFGAMFKQRKYSYKLFLSIFEAVSVLFYPLALGLGFPIILYFLAQEKEEKIKSLLEINGMRSYKYWLSTYVFFMIFFSLTSFVFYLTGFLLLDDGFFHKIPVFEFILFITLWNSNQILFSIFLMAFINSSGTATAVGYFISINFMLLFDNINQMIYVFPALLPAFYRVFPLATYTRIMDYYLILGDELNTPKEDAEYWKNMFALFLTAVIFGFLGIVLNEKRFQNRITSFFKFIFCCFKNNRGDMEDTEREVHISSTEQREMIVNQSVDFKDYAVVCHDIVKVYEKNGKKFKALDNLNLVISREEVCGLLGPNGAGKTTLINIITGFIKRDKGDIYLDGELITSSQSNKRISLCPQFDILWSTLSIYEHFMFFGMMRGLKGSDLDKEVASLAAKVDLEEFLHDKIDCLSGGMKRRVSLGIALMGQVDIVFLDEPSTGLDPKKRREFWKIIQEVQKDKTFIISTHLMEEAEFLCNRIGIINNGSLKAVGTSQYLKKEFCNWKIIELTFDEYNEDIEKELVEEFKGEVLYKFNRLLKVKIDNKENSYGRLLEFLEKYNGKEIKNWSVKKANLEDVFTKIKEDYD